MAPRSVIKQRADHSAGTYECTMSERICAEPSRDAREIGNTVPGQHLSLTAFTKEALDEPGVVYAQLETGGWIKMEKDGSRVFIPILLDSNNSVEFIPESGSPSIRASVRKSVLSPPTSGKYLPPKTRDQIEQGRMSIISGAKENSIKTFADNPRRKSSIRVSNDAADSGCILSDKNVLLAIRLGEKRFLENKCQQMQVQVDRVSSLLQQHIIFRQQQAINMRAVRFDS